MAENYDPLSEVRKSLGIPTGPAPDAAPPSQSSQPLVDPLADIRKANGIPDVQPSTAPPPQMPKTIGGFVGSTVTGLGAGAKENLANVGPSAAILPAAAVLGPPGAAAATVVAGLSPSSTQTQAQENAIMGRPANAGPFGQPGKPLETRAGDPVYETAKPIGNLAMSALEALALRRWVTNPLVTRAGPQAVTVTPPFVPPAPGLVTAVPANTVANPLLTTAAGQVAQASPIVAQPVATTVMSQGHPWLQTAARTVGGALEGVIPAIGEGASLAGATLGAAGGVLGRGLEAGVHGITHIPFIEHYLPKIALLSKLGPVLPFSLGAGGGYIPGIIDQRTDQPPMAQ